MPLRKTEGAEISNRKHKITFDVELVLEQGIDVLQDRLRKWLSWSRNSYNFMEHEKSRARRIQIIT
jgi:hypothetical protein